MSTSSTQIVRDEPGGSYETAILFDWGGDEAEEGSDYTGDVPVADPANASDSKPDIGALEAAQTKKSQAKRQRVAPTFGRKYRQPATSVVPDVTQLAIYKSSHETLIQRKKADLSSVRAQETKNLLKRLRDVTAEWGIIDELLPGRKGGCEPCIRRGHDCVVKLERDADDVSSDRPHTVVGRCIACAVTPATKPGRCDIVLETGKRGTNLAVKGDKPAPKDTDAVCNNPTSSASQRPSRAQSGSKTSHTRMDGHQEPSASYPHSSLQNQRSPAPARASTKRKRAGLDLTQDTGSSSSAISPKHTAKSPRISAPLHTAGTASSSVSTNTSVISAKRVSTSGSATNPAQPVIDEKALAKALAEIRSGAESVRVELVKSMPNGLDGRLESLFTMMDVELWVLDRVVSADEEVDKEEALDAVEFVSDFADSTSAILAESSQGGKLDFLSRTMFKVMRMHTDTLRRAITKV